MIKYKILILLMLLALTAFAKLNTISPAPYFEYDQRNGIALFPLYSEYIKLGQIPISTGLNFIIRQPVSGYPGDYFWFADFGLRRVNGKSKFQCELTVPEKEKISSFLIDNLYADSASDGIVSSLAGFAYDFPGGPRREAYGMFVDGDTVYVISGWLGKFISFYRVVPGDFRLSASELMKELDKITPLSKALKGKEDAFRHEADSTNYLLEYIDREGMFRVRNYLMKTVLPPSPPNSPDKFYNLIEITKFYDKEAIP